MTGSVGCRDERPRDAQLHLANHPAAVAELKKAGPAGATLAPTLQRLLKLKTRSQYQTMTIARQDATAAVDWARKLYEGARTIVQS